MAWIPLKQFSKQVSIQWLLQQETSLVLRQSPIINFEALICPELNSLYLWPLRPNQWLLQVAVNILIVFFIVINTLITPVIVDANGPGRFFWPFVVRVLVLARQNDTVHYVDKGKFTEKEQDQQGVVWAVEEFQVLKGASCKLYKEDSSEEYENKRPEVPQHLPSLNTQHLSCCLLYPPECVD